MKKRYFWEKVVSICLLASLSLRIGLPGLVSATAAEPTGETSFTILTVHSSPQAGEDWEVLFETTGTADLIITPQDQATINDLDFVSLKCSDEEKTPEIQENGVIFYSDWSCDGTAKVIHHVNVAGKHTLKFQFGGQIEYAYNNPGYSYYRTITIDHEKVPGDLTDHPFLFNTTEGDLATTGNGGHVTSASGYDIVFSPNTDGSNPYAHEIEKYDPATGEFVAHVKIPSISSTVDTVFYIVYGDSDVTTSQEDITGVWDSDFKMVLHFKESAENYLDSTVNNNDSTAVQVTSRTATGIAGPCPDFDGIDDYLNMGEGGGSLDFGIGDFTIEAWVKVPVVSAFAAIMEKRGAAPNHIPMWGVVLDTTGKFYCSAYDAAADGAVVIDAAEVDDDAWHYVVAAYDRDGNLTAYVDGSSSGTPAAMAAVGSVSNADDVWIGRRFDGGTLPLDGLTDEIRCSATLRSTDYITATYNNQSSPSTFYALGVEYTVPNYAYYRTITIDHDKVPGDLTDHPFMFNTTHNSLRTTGNGGYITSASGYDIVFSPNTDGSNPYAHEIEKYDAATGQFVAHVKIPSISSTVDTVFYICYGDSGVTTSQENITGVWDADFKGVWHLKESSGTFYDSTANDVDGGDQVSATGKSGQIDGGQDFDGVDDYIDIDKADYYTWTTYITLECWAYFVSNNQMYLDGWNYDGNAGWHISQAGGNIRFQLYVDGGVKSAQEGVPGDGWHYLVGRYDGSHVELYVDGNIVANIPAATGAFTAPDSYMSIGAYRYENVGMQLIMLMERELDEARISSIARSTDYITATYNNQSSPSTFYSVNFNTAPTAPITLYINESATTAQSGESDPVAVGDATPVFSAAYVDTDDGDIADYYQLVVYSDSECSSEVWDSTKTSMTNCTEGNRCNDIDFAGAALPFDGKKYYWKIKYWDDDAAEVFSW